jgi:hypothetical protein
MFLSSSYLTLQAADPWPSTTGRKQQQQQEGVTENETQGVSSYLIPPVVVGPQAADPWYLRAYRQQNATSALPAAAAVTAIATATA